MLAVWRPAQIPWGLSQLVRSPFIKPDFPGLLWRKVLGSGNNGGFGLRPGWDRLGLFCAFDDLASVREWLASAREPEQWRMRSKHLVTMVLEPFSSRGTWSGHALQPPDGVQQSSALAPQRVASLTRASIRLASAARFWSMSPAAEESLARASGCLLSVGLGEAPLLRQATFSVWAQQSDMDAYARSGAHLQAIREAYGQGFFSESMFTRFRVLEHQGDWAALSSSTARAAANA